MFLPILFAVSPLTMSKNNIDLFVGTYTVGQASKGIYRVLLDSVTGVLSTPILAAEAVNPSYLAQDSSGKFLYAVNESDRGEVLAFGVLPDHSLAKLNTQSSMGNAPCHLAVSPNGKSLLVANYGTGNVVCLPLRQDGSLDSVSGNFQNAGTGPNRDRQEGPHMHMVFFNSQRASAYACDLGTDELVRFPFNSGTDTADVSKQERVKLRAGVGPRHLVMSADGKTIYIGNELENSVSVLAFDGSYNEIKEVQNISTLPPDISTKVSKVAEIVLHPNGKWLYVSNRGYDSIAQYAIGMNGRVKLMDVFRLTVHEPRGFAIDPTGRWLVVGGQHSNNIASMGIDPKFGSLKPEHSIVRLPAPVCVIFAKP